MKWKIISVLQVFLVGVILFSGAKVFNYRKNTQHTDRIELESREQMKRVREEMARIDLDGGEDVEDGRRAISASFIQELRESYPEAIGHIEIASSTITYPIVQHEDSQFYLTHSPDQRENANGSIFLDHRNSPMLDDDNTIIYGHYTPSGKMFHDLYQFRDQSFADEVRTIELQTLDGPKSYRVFSVYDTDPDFRYRTVNYDDLEEKRAFIDTLFEKSLIEADGAREMFADDSRILTLSTCSNKGSTRLVVHGVEMSNK